MRFGPANCNATQRPLASDFAPHMAYTWARFSRGERFVHQPIPRAEFDGVFEQVKRWGLDRHLKECSFDKLVYRAAP